MCACGDLDAALRELVRCTLDTRELTSELHGCGVELDACESAPPDVPSIPLPDWLQAVPPWAWAVGSGAVVGAFAAGVYVGTVRR